MQASLHYFSQRLVGAQQYFSCHNNYWPSYKTMLLNVYTPETLFLFYENIFNSYFNYYITKTLLSSIEFKMTESWCCGCRYRCRCRCRLSNKFFHTNLIWIFGETKVKLCRRSLTSFEISHCALYSLGKTRKLVGVYHCFVPSVTISNHH